MVLEKIVDRVNHILLMEKLSKKIDDVRVLRLIRRHLEAGMMAGGAFPLGQKVRRKAGPWVRCYRISC
jgi:RNA-directed DNA polymerase